MSKKKILKESVSLLFRFHIVVLITILISYPLGYDSQLQKININDWNSMNWIIYVISIITYLILIRGIFFLKKVANHLLDENYFSEQITQQLKFSGNHFVISGLAAVFVFILMAVSTIWETQLNWVFNFSLMVPLFWLMTGLFFIIQSKALHLAKGYKEENDLTV